MNLWGAVRVRLDFLIFVIFANSCAQRITVWPAYRGFSLPAIHYM